MWDCDGNKGKGRKLFDAERKVSISRDGTRFAYRESGQRLGIVNSEGKLERTIVVRGTRGWLTGTLTWDNDGNRLFAGAYDDPTKQYELLYIGLNGVANRLHAGSVPTAGISSPDGRWLAIQSGTSTSNVWLIKGL